MTWRAAHSLGVLHAQLKAGSKAAPPATGAGEWGLIGDAAHDPASDHSPHDFPGWGTQIVTAADFPNRPDLGLDAHAVLDSIRRSQDGRVKYGISNGQMFSSYAAHGIAAWTWRPYSGSSDKHFTHGHISVVGDARADDPRPWQTIGGGELVASASEIIEALAGGFPKTADGTVVSPVAWRVRDEAWQKAVSAQVAANGSGLSALASQLATLKAAQVPAVLESIPAEQLTIDPAVLDAALDRAFARFMARVAPPAA